MIGMVTVVVVGVIVLVLLLLLSYHGRLRMAVRNATAARGMQASYSQLVHGVS